jgi:hypothetical protein
MSMVIFACAWIVDSALGEEGKENRHDSWRLELAQTAPEVPEDLWGIFVKGLNSTEKFKFGQAMRADTLESSIAAWSRKLNIRLDVRSSSILGQIQGVRVPLGEGTCTLVQKYQHLKSGPRVKYFALVARTMKGRECKIYRIPADKIAEIDFEVANVIYFSHPILGVTVERFSVDGGKLKDTLKKLLEKGGVRLGEDPRFDFSMNNAADSMEVSITARGRDVVDCLSMAVEAAGWKMSVNGRDPRSGFSYTHFNTYRIRTEREERDAGRTAVDLTRPGKKILDPVAEPYLEHLKRRIFEVAERFAKRPFRIVIGPKSG